MKTQSVAALFIALMSTLSCGPQEANLQAQQSSNEEQDEADGELHSASVRLINCRTADPANTKVKVRVTRLGTLFDIEARAASSTLFSVLGQRPSLNVNVQDGGCEEPNEFLDFRPAGLDVVPPLGTTRLELTLAAGPKTLTFVDPTTQTQLRCTVSTDGLLSFLKIAPVSMVQTMGVHAVGFDIDDTMMFTTPTFVRGFATGGLPTPGDVLFWTQTNACDRGCPDELISLPDGGTRQLPANEPSTVKEKALEIMDFHRARGHEVYAITARPDINGQPLREYLLAEFGLDRDHVFFEPENDQPGNPAGKTDRIKALDLDVFYGDSDSDITDTLKVEGKQVRPVRFLRSPKSSNRKDGRLNKYHPGYYGELIISNSYH